VLTVPEAARRVGRDPETVRRWIRSGRLRATKVGTQHVIDPQDLDAVTQSPLTLPMPERWRRSDSGRPAPDWVDAIRRSRQGR
jgi:excisionase family DNA binding protein